MSSPKQMMDFKPVKSVDANVSNEHQRNWSNELFERKAKDPNHNYDRTRTALNFQVGPHTMRMWSRLVKMDYERGYVFLSEFTAYETIDVLCPSLDFGLPDNMPVCFLILVQLLRTESHLTHPLTVAAEYCHDSPVGDSGTRLRRGNT